MLFADRIDAGRKLAAALEKYRDRNPLILALPRGGVPVAHEIASALNAPLDLLLVRKIGVPGHRELAMGAIVDGEKPVIVRNEEIVNGLNISQAVFDSVCHEEKAELNRRRSYYIMNGHIAGIAGRVVILVDDGIATGATMKAAIKGVKSLNAESIILAVPVGAYDAIREISDMVDEVCCLHQPENFGALSMFYEDFQQVDNAAVNEILAQYSDSA
jgi:putative phosphoribosyl transferase